MGLSGQEDVGLIVMRYVDGWCSYVAAMELMKNGPKTKLREASPWVPPRKRRYKVNVDASVGRDGRKRVGVVVRDKRGDIMVVACRRFKADWEVETVEAFAVHYGLDNCWKVGLRDLELETDSKLVADALNGRTKRLNYASNFVHDTLGSQALFGLLFSCLWNCK